MKTFYEAECWLKADAGRMMKLTYEGGKFRAAINGHLGESKTLTGAVENAFIRMREAETRPAKKEEAKADANSPAPGPGLYAFNGINLQPTVPTPIKTMWMHCCGTCQRTTVNNSPQWSCQFCNKAKP